MKVDSVCPKCYKPIPVRPDRNSGWVSCIKCGHVFRITDAVQALPQRGKSKGGGRRVRLMVHPG
jgi:hypothetical protein